MRIISDFHKIALEHKWKLNTDKNLVQNVLNAQNRLFEKFGQYYCPCKSKRSTENICPCNNAQIEISNKGFCGCRLFMKIKLFDKIKLFFKENKKTES